MKDKLAILYCVVFLIILGICCFYKKDTNEPMENKKQWHEYVDVFYYINLDHREDRKNELVGELKKKGVPENKIVRISAVNKKGQGDLGCSLSHAETMKQFTESNYKNCIVLEDDFVFMQELDTVNSFFNRFFENEIPYDVCMLSANVIDTKPTKYEFLQKVNNAQTTSGFMVAKTYAPVLLENFKEGAKLLEKAYADTGKTEGSFCVDQFWKSLQPNGNWYLFYQYPRMGKQRASFSDIQGGFLDYDVFTVQS